MKDQSLSQMKSAAILALSSFILFGCGSKFNGTFTLNQQGMLFSQNSGTSTGTTQTQNSNCNQITFNMSENSSQIFGTGSNGCYSEVIQGTNNNGQAMVTLTLNPVNYQYGSGTYVYQGMLTISGSSVMGTLSPAGSGSGSYGSYSNYGYGTSGYGSITITGTKN